MPQRGEIVVERLTGNRAMVIEVVSPEEITCRFADGRLEDRFTFEVDSGRGSIRSARPARVALPLGLREPVVPARRSGLRNRPPAPRAPV